MKCYKSVVALLLGVVVESCVASDVQAQAQIVATSVRATSISAEHDKLRVVVTQEKVSTAKHGQMQSANTDDLKKSLEDIVNDLLTNQPQGSSGNSLRGADMSANVEPNKQPQDIKIQSEIKMHEQVGIAVLSVPSEVDDATLQNMIASMMALDNVQSVEPDVFIRLEDFNVADTPVPGPSADNVTDPYTEFLWGMEHIGARVAYNEAALGKAHHRPLVTVIDTGVDINHPDLKENIYVNCAELHGEEGVDDDGNGYVDDVYGWNVLNRTLAPIDDNGHGTHCAGTIGAVMDNGIGVFGAHNRAKIVPCKFLNDSGSGFFADAVECIEYSMAVESYITSNSYGSPGGIDFFKVAIDRARDFGQLFVTSAGNSAGAPTYPAAYSATMGNVISVASIDNDDTKSSFSCYDPNVVSIAAPGGAIVSTCTAKDPGEYCTKSGTSMAAPHVAGAAALLKSLRPTWTYELIAGAIKAGAQPFIDWRDFTRWGCLDLAASINTILNEDVDATTTTTTTTMKCGA